MIKSTFKRVINFPLVYRLNSSNFHIKSFLNESNKGTDKYGNLYEVPEYPFEIPILDRSGESEANLRKRLIYQSRKRGILESDLILSTFIEKYLNKLSKLDCQQLDKLMDENDWDIYYWATEERKPPRAIEDTNVFQLLKEHAKNKDRKVLRMPDLK